MTERSYWAQAATRLAEPVLKNLAGGTLRQNMPVETIHDTNRKSFAHLEAFGRLLAGIAPWLALKEAETSGLSALAQSSLDSATRPDSPDFCNFTEGSQPLVDAAFLAQGILRAPEVLWDPLKDRVKNNLLNALRGTRGIVPGENNWILFSATVEAALFRMGAKDWDGMRIAYALRQHEQWYKGDGCYGDGAWFHMDYYNSFVIQPMLVDLVRAAGSAMKEAGEMEEKILTRSRRYAGILERLISPEGTFPPIGRSITYRFGTMQSLSQMALLHLLPEEVSPAQVREALSAVLRRFMDSPGIFDPQGWLKIGLGGHQPGLAEGYICTGSLYLFSAGLLPLGLPGSDPFWSDPSVPWTSVKAWQGLETPIDHALHP